MPECHDGTCVLVRSFPGHVEIHDTKHPDAPPLVYTPADWTTAVHAICNGHHPHGVHEDDDVYVWSHGGRELRFTAAEMQKLCADVENGDYDLPDTTRVA